jgi:hypothetical protein
MSSDGSYPTRASRRAERAPQSSRASAGTAAAILILAAILGFAGGALAGNSGGDSEDPSAESTADVGSDAPDDATDDEPDEPAEEDAASSVTLNASPGSVSAGGRIDLTGRIDPPVANVELRVERSIGDTESWDTFPSADDPVTATTNANGEFSTWVQSSRQGVNYWKVVGTVEGEFIESPVAEVSIN